MFDIEDYNYDLPSSLIAQVPTKRREESRLLLVDRQDNTCRKSYFYDIPDLLRPGDLLIVNNTKVVPAKLFGRKETGGRVEILVTEHPSSDIGDLDTRLCLMKSSKKPRVGGLIFFDSKTSGEIQEVLDNGLIRIAFRGNQSLDSLIEKKGTMPLPPYIKRGKGDDLTGLDKDRYQTIFSEKKGAVAAPTAGLHFSEDLIKDLEEKDIEVVAITLHVGHGTFRSVRTKDIRNHQLGHEFFRIEPDTAKNVNKKREAGCRVIAVGTTVVRTLETATAPDGTLISGEGKTDLLITPGFSFKAIDGIITNFHLPKSSLLFLVAAFAGLKLTMDAYEFAVKEKFRFYSYGDAMMIF